MSLVDRVREAIARSELSLYLIEHETDVLYPALRNLMAGKGGVRLSTADKLAAYFELRLVGPEDNLNATDHSGSLSDQLRAAILQSGQSVQRIQHAAGVRTDALTRFLAGEQDLLLVTADKLAHYFGLELVRQPAAVLSPVAVA
jgi:hypothetical protein